MNPKAVIFDMDGVLIDSMKYHIEAWVYAFSKFGVEINDGDIAILEGNSHDAHINSICSKYNVNFTTEERSQISTYKYEKYKEIVLLNVYPHVYEILELLSNRSILLGVVTSSQRWVVEKVDNGKLIEYFKAVVTHDDVAKKKPDPEPYLIGLRKLGMNVEDVIVVENSPLGIESAQKAGIETYAIETTLTSEQLNQADKVFPSHKELFNYFDKII